MGLNFLGLGFSFGAKDAGLVKQQGLVSKGFEAIKGALNGIGEATSLERMGEGLQRSVDHVSEVIQQVRGLTEGVNLTTPYEAQLQSLNVQSRALGANMGYTGSQLNRFASRATGLADSLNVSAQTASEAIDAVARGGDLLRVVGIRSAADATRYNAVFGSIQDLSAHLHQLRSEFGLTDEQIQGVAGSTVAMGRATGNVSGAFQNLAQVLQTVRQQAALQGAELDPAELSQSVRQVQALSAGFYQMTHNASEAQQMAMTVLQSQLGARENFQGLFAGTQDDLSSFFTDLAVAQGDVNRAFEQMRQGPQDFIVGLAQMVRQARRNGPITAEQFNFLARRIETVMPGAGQAVVNFMRSADDSTLAVMSDVQGATANLGQMAREAHRTGRTLQEEFDRIKAAGILAFRSIGRRESVQLVRDTATEFRNFNSSMREIVSQGGPMAVFVEKLSAIHQIGALALIPRSLRPMAVLFGHITEQLVPLVTALGAMGFRLSALLSPYTLVIAAAGFLLLNFFDLYVHTRSLSGAFEQLGERITTFAGEAWAAIVGFADRALTLVDQWADAAADWAEKFDWGTFFSTWINRALHAALRAGDWLREVADTVFVELGRMFTGQRAATRIGRIVQNLGSVIGSVVSGLGDSLGQIDWSAAARVALMGLLDTMLGPLLGTVAAVAPWRRIATFFEEGMQRATAYLQSGAASNWAGALFGKLRKQIEQAAPLVRDAVVRLARRVPGYIAEGIDVGASLTNHLLVFLRGAMDSVRAWFDANGDDIAEVASRWLTEALTAIGQGLLWLHAQTQDALARLWDHLPSLLGNLGNYLESAANAALSVLRTLTDTLLRTIENMLARAFPQYADTIHSIMGRVRDFYRFMYDTFLRGVVGEVFGGVRRGLGMLVDVFRFIGSVASEVAAFIRDPWGQLQIWMERTWGSISTYVIQSMESVLSPFSAVRSTIAEGVEYLRGLFTSTGGTFQGSIGGAIDWVSEKWESFKARVREGIESVSGLLRSIFGGGGEVQTAVSQSDRATEVVAGQARGMIQDTTRAVSGGILSGLVGAFRSGFTTVLRHLGDFKDQFIGLFTRFGRTLGDKIGEALSLARSAITGLLEDTETALEAVQHRLQSLLSARASISATAISIAPAGAQAQPGAPSLTPSRPLGHAATNDDVRDAIHDPAWYRHYVAFMDAKLTALTAAVERGNRTGPGTRRPTDAGSTAENQRAIQQAVQAGG